MDSRKGLEAIEREVVKTAAGMLIESMFARMAEVEGAPRLPAVTEDSRISVVEVPSDPKGGGCRNPRERAEIAEKICDLLFKAESAGMSRGEIGQAISKAPKYHQSYTFRTALQYVVSDGRVVRLKEGPSTRYVMKAFAPESV